MIWQDDMKKARDRRDWACFYGGCAFTALTILLVVAVVTHLTGGPGVCR